MTVDKFGKYGETVYPGTNTANLTNSFVRRDGVILQLVL